MAKVFGFDRGAFLSLFVVTSGSTLDMSAYCVDQSSCI